MTTDIFDENAYNHALKEQNLSAEEIRWIRECREHPFRQHPLVAEALHEVDLEVEQRHRALEARDWWNNLEKRLEKREKNNEQNHDFRGSFHQLRYPPQVLGWDASLCSG